MNAERLIALYERVADAPDAVARVRRFILELAVRGKLVPQDVTEEPATELLKQISAERARLVALGEIRKPKSLQPVIEPPFDVPNSWLWTRLRQVTSDRGQQEPTGPFTYVDVGAIDKEAGVIADPQILAASDAPSRARKLIAAGDVIYSCVRPYLLNVAIVQTAFDPPAIASTAFAVLNGYGLIEPKYIWVVMRSPFIVECVEDSQRGQAYPAINDADLAILPFPLPPLSEQRRIVAKVDELMALLDRLETTRHVREATRDWLAAAALTRLTAPDTPAEEAAANTHFALNTLPALTTRPDQIKVLRQTILNLAVRGKLVAQDPTDNPLPRIDKDLQPETATPFNIPQGWQWSRLRALGALKGGGTPPKARDDLWSGHIPWVSPKDMKVNYIEAAQLSITNAALVGSAVKIIEVESVLFVVRGMILAHSFPVAISKVPLTINQDMKAISLKRPEMAEYILRALKGLTPEMLARVQRSSHGTCRIEGSDYGDFLIPLPPLAEQHRIVARVDAMMALCDQLEAALTTANATRTRLLEALLHDALALTELDAAA